MCGIFGYAVYGLPQRLDAVLGTLFDGLQRLEVRRSGAAPTRHTRQRATGRPRACAPRPGPAASDRRSTPPPLPAVPRL